jgi:ribosome modulation factor
MRDLIFEEGVRAYNDGLAVSECPYGPGTAQYRWVQGWEYAYYQTHPVELEVLAS